MSFVEDQIRRIDSQLDRLQLSGVSSAAEQWHAYGLTEDEAHDPAVTSRVTELQALIKSLSTTSTAKYTLVSPKRILAILEEARLSSACPTCQRSLGFGKVAVTDHPVYVHELEWLLISKATIQAYGQILNTILEQTIPLSEDIWYWDDVLGSYRYAGLYSIQTSPLRVWAWTRDVYHGVRSRGGAEAFAKGWGQFYGLVKESIHERSIARLQRQVVSPLARVRNEARKKQAALQRTRQINANALGVLLGEGLTNDGVQEQGYMSPADADVAQDYRHRWKNTTAKTVALMEAVLQNVRDTGLPVDKFDEAIASTTQDDEYYQRAESSRDSIFLTLMPVTLAERLQHILTSQLPIYRNTFSAVAREHGRPPVIVRYWLPASLLLVSSSTILRVFVSRKAELVTWVRELGTTIIDFWANWVIEPAKKIIGTIRHDEGSEVSILSKKSLEGDRASLERMVVDFAIDHPEGSLDEAQIAEIRTRVREGDLTPVLKAYEKDMQKPFVGAVKGNLIRALLIQIQKTKVDVEVAMSGIDSILKSQELLFGFIGLTPGVLVCIGTFQWLSDVFGSRRGMKIGQRRGHLMKILRNIDRVLVTAIPTDGGELSYKDHGLLLCEVHVLRQSAGTVLPRRVFHDFLQEIEDLVDIRAGLTRQQKVVERMRWAYSKWLV